MIPRILSSTEVHTVSPTTEAVGCRSEFHWCESTPRVPFGLYVGAWPLLAVAYPAATLSLAILYSKILGPRHQVCTFWKHMIKLPFCSLLGLNARDVSGFRQFGQNSRTYISQVGNALALHRLFHESTVARLEELIETRNGCRQRQQSVVFGPFIPVHV